MFTILGLIIAVLLFLALRWLILHSPFTPEVNRVLMIVLWVVAVIVIVWLLLGLLGLGASLNTRVP